MNNRYKGKRDKMLKGHESHGSVYRNICWFSHTVSKTET